MRILPGGRRPCTGHCMSSILSTILLLGRLAGPTSAYTPLSDASLRLIPAVPEADFDIHALDSGLLGPLLIPRVPGTPGSEKAQQHFASFFATQLPRWKVEWHNTTARTPATGTRDVPFRSLIARRDPPWAAEGDVGRLTLVAHYDSLYRPEGFVGATDSAAPCAMLLHAARAVEEALEARWRDVVARGDTDFEDAVGVQILLLDGEEAWVSWSASDSLYGARALAEAWESQVHPALSNYRNPLTAISLFVLLDLLGSGEPRVPSYFLPTHWAYQNMATIEKRMRDLGLLETKPRGAFLPESGKKSSDFTRSYVEDDHVPFMARGVEVLHIIPSPFPDVWHHLTDDGAHLDLPTTRDWARIVAAFVAEWMDLEGHLPAAMQEREEGERRSVDVEGVAEEQAIVDKRMEAEAVAAAAAHKIKVRREQQEKLPLTSKTEL